ncbi:MAG: hypothetical protein AAGF95_02805 [Chloroflexota bacterium]
MNQPLVDESVLDDIPSELIRPLLAMSIRADRPHTIETYQALLDEMEPLMEACSKAGGQSLYYVKIRAKILRCMRVMIDAQTWGQQRDPALEATSVDIYSWVVGLSKEGYHQDVLLQYKGDGLDYETMEKKIRPVVVEATEDDF